MSKLEVDQIDPQSGTTLTLGSSGDTVSIPAGVSLSSGATLTAPVLAGSASSAGKVLFKEDTDNGTNSVTLIGPAATADVIVTLPAATDTLVGKATTDTLTNKTINASQLMDGTINTAKIANDAVTYGKIQHTTTANRVIGAASAGAVGEVQVATDMVADNAINLAKMASGTDGNIISYDTSGNPVAVATGNDGQVLTSAGAGAIPTFETLPVGGITNAQQWRITAAQQNMGNGDHVTNNWEQADSFGYGGIGSAMGQSQGIFTFPATGIWLVQFTYNGNDGSAQNYVGGIITATTNNSSYGEATQGNSSIQANGYFTGTINFMFDVTSTSTHKVRFAIHCATGQIALTGNTNRTDTGAVFIRLGDT